MNYHPAANRGLTNAACSQQLSAIPGLATIAFKINCQFFLCLRICILLIVYYIIQSNFKDYFCAELQMNFLAHIYLSGDTTEVLIGNFIGDYVKGNDYLKYPEGIRKGILMHREIDTFTDKHPATRSCKTFIKPKYKKFSGIVVDIFYDHFLATNWERYSSVPLKEFVIQKYNVLEDYFDFFPEEVQKFFPYFLKSNWLHAYSTFNGLRLVLRRMAFRTSIPDFSFYAIAQLKENYEVLGNNFSKFFDDILDFVKTEFSIQPVG